MTKHAKAFTYEPKIPAVRSGECRQTIRTGDKIQVGDEILWHGLYRNMWTWHIVVTVTEAIPIVVDHDSGIRCHCDQYNEFNWYEWSGLYTNYLAKLDFIDPPTGFALRDVLEGFYGKMKFVDCQIIRW